MITYRTMKEDSVPFIPTIKIPILHRVPYDQRHTFFEIYHWCEEYCVAQYYTSPGWSGSFVEFEDDEDAVLFALRWA
jgi:hypothetical protein